MLQYTYLPNGDLRITTDTSDGLVREMVNQSKQDMVYIPNTFIPYNINNPICRANVRNRAQVPTLVNPSYQVYDISPVRRRLVTRDPESFFTMLYKQLDDGYDFEDGTAKMTFGSYSAYFNKVETPVNVEPVQEEFVQTFDIDTALAIDDKDELVSYAQKFGIELDKRKTLPKLKNWLKAKSLQGE